MTDVQERSTVDAILGKLEVKITACMIWLHSNGPNAPARSFWAGKLQAYQRCAELVIEDITVEPNQCD